MGDGCGVGIGVGDGVGEGAGNNVGAKVGVCVEMIGVEEKAVGVGVGPDCPIPGIGSRWKREARTTPAATITMANRMACLVVDCALCLFSGFTGGVSTGFAFRKQWK